MLLVGMRLRDRSRCSLQLDFCSWGLLGAPAL